MFLAANRHTAQAPTAPPHRGGFSLVELMVVIVIIGILMALILPAITGGMTRARSAQVASEIEKMSTAIAEFKAKFGFDPPSHMVLHPDQAGWNSDARSRSFIRRMWPQFNFNGDGGLGIGAAVDLDGSECLVFFLGGVRDPSGALKGFSTHPATPFISGGNREGPFFEFDPQRLVDDGDGDDFLAYLDPLPSQQSPYLYASSYDGRGYDSADIGGFEPYTQGGLGTPYLNPTGYQLISPGSNGAYGIGGALETEDSNGNTTLDPGEDTNANGALDTERNAVLSNLNSGGREVERDNITNFHDGGELVP